MSTQVLLPRPLYATVVSHVVRKLTGHYLEGETPERKAFGILAGRPADGGYIVTSVFPLLVNLRRDDRYRQDMDEVVSRYAIASDTPNEQRGWIAHPSELLAIEHACDEYGWLMLGNYHTHRVAWQHDPLRDTCTELDRALAAGGAQWTFIVSAVDLHRPLLRAFYEADNSHEATIRLLPDLVTPLDTGKDQDDTIL